MTIQVPPDLRAGAPTYVGIGAQKSGTSWVHRCIVQHPQCYGADYLAEQVARPSHVKEHHFFDRFFGASFGAAEIEEYHRWCARPAPMVVGEWTPSYMADAWIPALLRRAAPDAKILVMLRDPVERFLSGMNHASRHIELERGVATSHVERGFYFRHLSRWLSHFDPSAFLVMQYEACVQNPRSAMAAVFRHIGVDDQFRVPEHVVGKRFNPRSKDACFGVPDHVRRALVDEYAGEVRDLSQLVPELDLGLWRNFAPSCRRAG